MQSRSLQAILTQQTQVYLTMDNPPSKTLINKAITFFSARGIAGRTRAQRYQDEVINKLADDVLLSRVYRDLNRVLMASTVYRRRLMEGLCDYLKIDLSHIEAAMAKNVLTQISNVSAGSELGFHWETMRDIEMLSAISKKVCVNSNSYIPLEPLKQGLNR